MQLTTVIKTFIDNLDEQITGAYNQLEEHLADKPEGMLDRLMHERHAESIASEIKGMSKVYEDLKYVFQSCIKNQNEK